MFHVEHLMPSAKRAMFHVKHARLRGQLQCPIPFIKDILA